MILKRSNRTYYLTRIKELEAAIINTVGQLKGYRDEINRLQHEWGLDKRRLEEMIELAGYIIQQSEIVDFGIEVELTEATRFKGININAVQRKLGRLNLHPSWFSLERDRDGHYARDENGHYTYMIKSFVVDWRGSMSKADIEHQMIELGFESPPLTEEQIKQRAREDAEFPFLGG